MKILLLAPHDFYIDRGSPMDTDILLRALSDSGHEVDAVVYREGDDRTYPGVVLHRARTPRWLTGIRPGFSLKKVLADLWLFASARRLVRTHRYDVVHASEESAFIALWLHVSRGLPYVYDMDSSMAHQMVEARPWLSPLGRIFDAIVGMAVRHAAAAAPVCNALAELAERHGAKRVVTLHDISQLPEEATRPSGALRRRLGLDGPLVMYVGNFEAYQGVDLLLDAFARLVARGSNAHLALAGGIPDHIRQCKERAATLGIADRTHFLGPWPAERLGELLAESDVLTSPRIRGLNTPMKIFPFLHSGRPLLATDLLTHTQILTDAVARLAPPEPEAFANALEELCVDGALRDRLGAAGRAFVERNHTFQAHRRRVDVLYGYLESALSAPEDGVEVLPPA